MFSRFRRGDATPSLAINTNCVSRPNSGTKIGRSQGDFSPSSEITTATFFSFPSSPSSPPSFDRALSDPSPYAHLQLSPRSPRVTASPFLLRRFSFSVDHGDTYDSWVVPHDLCNPDTSLPEDVDQPVVPDHWPINQPGSFATRPDLEWEAVLPDLTSDKQRTGSRIEVQDGKAVDLTKTVQWVSEQIPETQNEDNSVEAVGNKGEQNRGVKRVTRRRFLSTCIKFRLALSSMVDLERKFETSPGAPLANPSGNLSLQSSDPESKNLYSELAKFSLGQLEDFEAQDLIDSEEFETFNEEDGDELTDSRRICH